MIATTSHGSNWKLFLRQAEEDSNGAVCENTISAIRDTDRHAARVKLLRSLKPSDWNRVKKLLLPLTRFALVRAVGLPDAPSVAEAPVEAPVADTITCVAIVNATAHYQWNCRWSAALSLYYSAWDYGRSDCKFRTFIFRPEVRYWTRRAGSGLFFDAHVAMAAYNFALPSWDYRIQDVDGTHPALGGGLGIGWRQNLSRRWALEFQAGAGVYALRSDRFGNCPILYFMTAILLAAGFTGCDVHEFPCPDSPPVNPLLHRVDLVFASGSMDFLTQIDMTLPEAGSRAPPTPARGGDPTPTGPTTCVSRCSCSLWRAAAQATQ